MGRLGLPPVQVAVPGVGAEPELRAWAAPVAVRQMVAVRQTVVVRAEQRPAVEARTREAGAFR